MPIFLDERVQKLDESLSVQVGPPRGIAQYITDNAKVVLVFDQVRNSAFPGRRREPLDDHDILARKHCVSVPHASTLRLFP